MYILSDFTLKHHDDTKGVLCMLWATRTLRTLSIWLRFHSQVYQSHTFSSKSKPNWYRSIWWSSRVSVPVSSPPEQPINEHLLVRHKVAVWLLCALMTACAHSQYYCIQSSSMRHRVHANSCRNVFLGVTCPENVHFEYILWMNYDQVCGGC